VVERGLGSVFEQVDSDVRFEWGPTGAAHLADEAACLVVVDVLSFTTAVTVAVGRGMAVFPYRFGDASAEDFALAHNAELAVRRSHVSRGRPWSLSPVDLSSAQVAPRLVLPSPNGSVIAAAATSTVVAACLRNASAVSRWLLAHGYGTSELPAVVVASGERWPDGSLRPALEDALGAGAVLKHLGAAGCALSPEATAVAAIFEATGDLKAALRSCGSGRQMNKAGYGGDVEMALEVDCDESVPVLRDGAFSSS
jgi:2-phosphosulfolactate phosphatase